MVLVAVVQARPKGYPDSQAYSENIRRGRNVQWLPGQHEPCGNCIENRRYLCELSVLRVQDGLTAIDSRVRGGGFSNLEDE